MQAADSAKSNQEDMQVIIEKAAQIANGQGRFATEKFDLAG